MKYWIFQNNQVLGPYEPEALGEHAAFSAESLVCPEGRRGTSMGDWQRAGMVPDLSVALVKAAQAQSVRAPVATLPGLAPEPTLKDLAVLGGLREKMGVLEDVVKRLQDELAAKNGELAALREEVVGKERRSSEALRETDALKGKIAELERHVAAAERLAETVDKAVEAEKHVERDVETQGQALADLGKEIEALRVQVRERLEPSPAAPEMVRAPEAAIPPAPAQNVATPAFEFPAPTPLPSPTQPAPFDPLSAPASGEEPPAAEAPTPSPPAAPSPRSKRLVFAGLAGLVAAAALAVAFARFSSRKAPPRGAETTEVPSLPAPSAPSAPAAPSAPPPAPTPDPREVAIAAVKSRVLPGGRTLGATLETLSPPSGNLTPWMAEPLPDGRALVNYFAHASEPGSPTVAYEFEVDPAAGTVSGRNAAAKAALDGKIGAPPAPPKPRRVRVRRKQTASRKPAASAPPSTLPLGLPAVSAPAAAKPLDSADGEARKPAKPAKADAGKAADEALLDDLLKE